MKILYLCREFPYPADSGVKQRNWYILAKLAESHEVHLVSYGSEADAKNEVVSQTCRSVGVVPPPPKRGDGDKTTEMFVGLFSDLPYAIQSRFNPLFKTKVEDLVSSENFDLIICDSIYHAQHLPAVSCPKILNEHNIESVIIQRYALVENKFLRKCYARFEGWRMACYEEKVWRSFARIWMCSPVDRQEVLSRVPAAQVDVVPNGVDIKKLAPRKVHVYPARVVYSGLIGWHPNEDAVLYFAHKIYPLIKRQVPTLEFFIVGKGPSQSVQDLANFDSSIHVTGMVPEVTPFIEEAVVVIVPLRIGSGTRLKILEAMALGKAVVSTSVGCEGLDVRDGENILIADDPQRFAEKVIHLIKDPAFCDNLGARGRQLVEKIYSWDAVGEIIKGAIATL